MLGWAMSSTLETALEAMRHPEDPPQFEWARRFLADYDRSVRRWHRDERGRFTAATEGKQRQTARRIARLVELDERHFSNRAIAYQIAAEEGHSDAPFDLSTVKRWRKAGRITRPPR
jgi:hypothetical protein